MIVFYISERLIYGLIAVILTDVEVILRGAC